MAVIRSGPVLEQLGQLFAVGAVGTLTDAQLLALFLAGRGAASESAFAAIVDRHGPMVLRVCRILLGDAHEAEDAFQATFLVLARRAGSLRDPDRLANWLYGVAHRTSRKARSRSGRRRLREAREGSMAGLAFELADREPPPDLALARREEAATVHQELERLPEKHRAAIVLCCLEGLTIEEAAGRLRCTPGAVRGQLAQARSRLRARLRRRGVEVPAGVLAAALSAQPASAIVTSAMRDATTRAAIAYAAGLGVAASASGSAPALADGVSRSLMLARLMVVAAVVLGASVLGVVAAPLAPRGSPSAGARPGPESAGGYGVRTPADRGPGARDHRRLVEELDWFLGAVDPARGTIALEDLPDLRGGTALAVTTVPGGSGPTGLTLGDIVVIPGARITLDGAPAGLESLRPGMRVAVRLAPDRFVVAEIRMSSPHPPAFHYVVEEVDADARTLTVTLKPKDLRLAKIRVAEDAPIQITRMEQSAEAGPDSAARIKGASLREIRPGMHVSLTLAANEAGELVARSLRSGGRPDAKEPSR